MRELRLGIHSALQFPRRLGELQPGAIQHSVASRMFRIWSVVKPRRFKPSRSRYAVRCPPPPAHRGHIARNRSVVCDDACGPTLQNDDAGEAPHVQPPQVDVGGGWGTRALRMFANTQCDRLCNRARHETPMTNCRYRSGTSWSWSCRVDGAFSRKVCARRSSRVRLAVVLDLAARTVSRRTEMLSPRSKKALRSPHALRSAHPEAIVTLGPQP